MLLPITSPSTTALPRPPVPVLCPLLRSLASPLKLLIEVDLDYDLGCDMGQVRYSPTKREKKWENPIKKPPDVLQLSRIQEGWNGKGEEHPFSCPEKGFSLQPA